jgi:murein DD-endopeptidase MepM/ murein hydrolase activator NlpD
MRLPLLLLWLGIIRPATYAKATQTSNDTLLPPMDIPLVLAGNFAELRNNHFHAGLDLKTQQREGIPIRSVADGYVSRIKVSPWGYGKVIYITHPNQTTTVYAHLQKFSGPIETYVKKEQYGAES